MQLNGSGSNGNNGNPASAARSMQLLASLSSTWSGRGSREPHALNAALVQTLQSVLPMAKRIPDVALHQHTATVLEALEAAVDAHGRQNPSTTEAATPAAQASAAAASSLSASSSVAAASSSTAASTAPASLAASSRPFVPSPLLQALFLRLLLLQVQRLPALYRAAWEAASKSDPPAPIAAGMDLDAYLAFFTRARNVCARLVDTRVVAGSSSGRLEGWSGAITCRAFHAEVLAFFHAPPELQASSETDSDAGKSGSAAAASPMRAFWERLSTLLRGFPFVDALLQYAELKDVLTHLSALVNNEKQLGEVSRLTMMVLRAWRLPLSTAKSALHASNSGATRIAPHDHSFLVTLAPPSLAQHDALLSFLSLQTDALWHREHEGLLQLLRAAQQKQQNDEDTQTEESNLAHPMSCALIKDIVAECRAQFRACTDAPSSSSSFEPLPFERCLLPLFALLGVLQSLDGNDEQRRDLLRGLDVAPPVAQARAEVLYMLQHVLRMPELLAISRPGEVTTSSAAAAAYPQASAWPCCTTNRTTCASCLFVWLVSAAVMHAARFIADAALSTPASVSASSASVSSSPSLSLHACWVLLRSFEQLIDCTWVLHGRIQPNGGMIVENTTASSTDAAAAPSPSLDGTHSALKGSTSDEKQSFAGTKAGSVASAAAGHAGRRRAMQLISWMRSPFYVLLPHYSRALGVLFLSLRNRQQEASVLASLWQRVKYVHLVWRWYGLYCTTSLSPGAVAARTVVQAVKDAAAEQKAIRRIKEGAKMQPTNNPIDLQQREQKASTISHAVVPSSSASFSPIADPFSLSKEAPLNSVLLTRSHGTLMMSVSMFLASIVRNDSWRALDDDASLTPSPSSSSSNDANRDSNLSPTQWHAYSLACMIDVVSLLEFARVADNFTPHQLLVAGLIAFATGKELPETQSKASVDDATPHSAEPPSAAVAAAAVVPVSRKAGSWTAHAERAHQATVRRESFARLLMRTYLRCFFQAELNPAASAEEAATAASSAAFSTADLFDRVPAWLGLESQRDYVAQQCSAWTERPTALAALLAQSGRPFAPTLWEHPALRVPDLASAPWPTLCLTLVVRPPTAFPKPQQDLLHSSRLFFLARMFHGCANSGSIEWPLQFHLLLPFAFSLFQHPQPDLNALIQHLLCSVLRHGYEEATGSIKAEAARDREAQEMTQLQVAPLPAPVAGAALEAFVRQLVPFYAQTLLSLYPRIVSARSVIDAFMSLFAMLPTTDVLLLHLLSLLADRAAVLLQQLMRDSKSLPRWRQMVDLLADADVDAEGDEEVHANRVANNDNGAQQKQQPQPQQEQQRRGTEDDQREQTAPAAATTQSTPRKPSADTSSAPAWMHRVPPNVRLPRSFPRESFAATRSLLLLYLQLMQHLDGVLYPRALSLLEALLVDTLDPRGGDGQSVATPLRGAVASLIHQTLVRSFDLNHRERTVAWFIELVRRLSIPIGIKEQQMPQPPPAQQQSKTGNGDSKQTKRQLSKEDQERLRQLAELRRTSSANALRR
jgi:hypothetical protein